MRSVSDNFGTLVAHSAQVCGRHRLKIRAGAQFAETEIGRLHGIE
jgi:hypothetical protein